MITMSRFPTILQSHANNSTNITLQMQSVAAVPNTKKLLQITSLLNSRCYFLLHFLLLLLVPLTVVKADLTLQVPLHLL